MKTLTALTVAALAVAGCTSPAQDQARAECMAGNTHACIVYQSDAERSARTGAALIAFGSQMNAY